ncbi:hypothetical protein [Catenuloplanes indicus]|uniref:Uncharacterized protein n=1 Tax=Catenuloplanes indicus TaxID=137267 RepID=A0AAE3VU70_9ACTN|nr:hypothetical protein [Catenuloplanes indicus]MDQ0363404.1 hypothetical protein [Catenuloplanes indicus]
MTEGKRLAPEQRLADLIAAYRSTLAAHGRDRAVRDLTANLTEMNHWSLAPIVIAAIERIVPAAPPVASPLDKGFTPYTPLPRDPLAGWLQEPRNDPLGPGIKRLTPKAKRGKRSSGDDDDSAAGADQG